MFISSLPDYVLFECGCSWSFVSTGGGHGADGTAGLSRSLCCLRVTARHDHSLPQVGVVVLMA